MFCSALSEVLWGVYKLAAVHCRRLACNIFEFIYPCFSPPRGGKTAEEKPLWQAVKSATQSESTPTIILPIPPEEPKVLGKSSQLAYHFRDVEKAPWARFTPFGCATKVLKVLESSCVWAMLQIKIKTAAKPAKWLMAVFHQKAEKESCWQKVQWFMLFSWAKFAGY